VKGCADMRDTFLFDLDGTLLPMDFHKFMEVYFKSIGNYFKDVLKPEELVAKINEATKVTITTNDGRLNEEKFMTHFEGLVDLDLSMYKEMFDKFYDTDFFNCKETTWTNDYMIKSIKVLQDKGYKLVIATNPLLPIKSNYHRINWAGLSKDDFSYISSFEGNAYCKPHLEFYKEVLKNINKTPEKCYMIGNDRTEDLVATKLGIKTYLVTDCEMDNHGLNIPPDYRSDSKGFYDFVCSLDHIK